MLKELVQKYGIDKVNTLTKYPSILTLHKFGDKGRFTNETTTDFEPTDGLYATEKIDGTNVRIICIGDEYIIGSRNELLAYSDDLCYNSSQTIVENIRKLIDIPKFFVNYTVIYGELFGGKVSKNSKQYGGKTELGFRCFDIATILNPSDILEKELSSISHWREHSTGNGLEYGHSFLNVSDLKEQCKAANIPIVPTIELTPTVEDMQTANHQTFLNYLSSELPKTKVALSDNAGMKPEGIVLRNFKRSKIVKLRFEDYRRTLR